jgi:hypothetical protein
MFQILWDDRECHHPLGWVFICLGHPLHLHRYEFIICLSMSVIVINLNIYFSYLIVSWDQSPHLFILHLQCLLQNLVHYCCLIMLNIKLKSDIAKGKIMLFVKDTNHNLSSHGYCSHKSSQGISHRFVC